MSENPVREMSLEELSSLFCAIKANLVGKYRALEEEGKKQTAQRLRYAWADIDSALWRIDNVVNQPEG